ncbi:glycosyltransferase family 4 protein [Pseudodesulfovibrio sp.]|uniref:glycosyltransferase family 4 protein n=1 Tax=Pseudodesulfovibrio sp. TaxID=2035812 RepID=UPI00260DF4A6|nr:glycosyltransferase family 4 protein [Pseudodesulfovibrio sp.]MDD3312787.1 glycosyltransferase family 4 protein [Pseudodesulfovibrio sp.]
MPRPRSIALLTSSFERGGACRVMTNMANYWAARGVAVTLFSFEDGSTPPFYPLDERTRMVYLHINRYSPNLWASLVNNAKRFARIRREIRRVRPDAVISFIDTANVRTLIALTGLDIPVVVSERIDPAFEEIGPLWTRLRRWTYPLAARVVVQTRQAAAYFSDLAPERLAIIPNPVIPMPVTGDAPGLRRPALLAVGRMYPQKGYDLLLRAFARCAPEHPDWTLHVAGDGPLWDELHRLAGELGLAGRVRFLGQVRDVGGALAQTDAYVMSSAYEGFPNALCEAMAGGVACVSTDCPSGPADIIAHGVNGLLARNGDAASLAGELDRLMGDPELRVRLGRAAAGIVETFSEERVMGMWEACLDQAGAGGAQ